MTSKSRGYLLVDISIAMTIFSILSFGIFTFYKTYKRIDGENKGKIECLNDMNYIFMELKYNLDFNKILELDLDKEYIFEVENNSAENKLLLKDNLFIENIKKVDDVLKEVLNKEHIKINIINENTNSSNINEGNILNIEIKFMKNSEQCLYENTIKKYRYIL